MFALFFKVAFYENDINYKRTAKKVSSAMAFEFETNLIV